MQVWAGKTITIALTSLMAVAWASALWAKELPVHPILNTPSNPEHRETWVAFGDSITGMENTMLPPEGAWPNIVGDTLGINIINAGVAGDTTERALGRINTDVLVYEPDVVLVMFGINDQSIPNGAYPGAFRVPPKQFTYNLGTIVKALQHQGIRVILMTNRPIIQGPGRMGQNLFLNRHGNGGKLYPTPAATHDSIRRYNNIIRSLAKRYHTDLVDMWQKVVERGGGDSDRQIMAARIDKPGLANDGVHLGPGGHRVIAAAVLSVLQ